MIIAMLTIIIALLLFLCYVLDNVQQRLIQLEEFDAPELEVLLTAKEPKCR